MSNKDWLLVALLGLIWGSSFLFAELLLPYLPPLVIVYLRVAVAALIMLLVVCFANLPWQRLDIRTLLCVLVMGLLNNVLPFSLIVIGQQTTTAGLASILNTTTAFFTVVLAAVFIPQERLTSHRLIGVIVGMLGVVIVLDIHNIVGQSISTGAWLIILATLSYALAAIWGKKHLSHLPPLMMATLMLLASTLILSPYVLIQHGSDLTTLSASNWMIAALFSILCTVLAYWLYFKVLNSAGAGNLSISTILVPPSAIILEMVFLRHGVTAVQLLGFVVMIVGLIILDGRVFAILSKVNKV